jgi:hypothetical protein
MRLVSIFWLPQLPGDLRDLARSLAWQDDIMAEIHTWEQRFSIEQCLLSVKRDLYMILMSLR